MSACRSNQAPSTYLTDLDFSPRNGVSVHEGLTCLKETHLGDSGPSRERFKPNLTAPLSSHPSRTGPGSLSPFCPHRTPASRALPWQVFSSTVPVASVATPCGHRLGWRDRRRAGSVAVSLRHRCLPPRVAVAGARAVRAVAVLRARPRRRWLRRGCCSLPWKQVRAHAEMLRAQVRRHGPPSSPYRTGEHPTVNPSTRA